MSFFDSASLVQIPSGVKDGVLYSVKPIDGSGDLTFSRGSDIEATRVNANGYIEKAQVNLLLQSNSFDTTWSNSQTTVTSGATDPNGGTTAWTLDKSGAAARIQQSITLSGVHTYSIYLKEGTLTDCLLNTGTAAAYYSLDGITVDTTSGADFIDAGIEDIGSGWRRAWLTFTGSQTIVRCYPAATGGDISGSTGNILIWRAQVNYGLVAQTYQETTTAAVVSGITDNMPRLNYDAANPTCPSLLLEPSRTNEVAFSEYFNGGIWIQTGSSVTDNDAISPEGVQNAAKVQGDGSQDYIRLYDNITYSSTGNWTLSVFAKAGNNDFLRVQFGGVDGAQNAYFDLANGTTEESWASIEQIGSDGWYRCSVTANLTGPDLTGNYNFYPSYSYTTSTFPSAGDANGQYVYLYGAQLEQASYKSSYLPTYGSSATRTADACSKTGISSLIGQTEGTLFVEFSSLSNSVVNEQIGLSDGTDSNTIKFVMGSVISGIQAESRVGGVTQFSIKKTTADYISVKKLAVSYKQNDIVFYMNGVQIGADSTATIPALSVFNFASGAGAFNVTGNAKQVLLFKTRLSNADLATLTSL